MSQHRSLRGSDVSIKQRNVLKRYERIKRMTAEGKEVKRGLGLPKLRTIKK